MLKKYLLLLILLSWGQSEMIAQNESYSRVRVYLDGQHIHNLVQLGLECDHGRHQSNQFWESDVSQQEIQLLEQNGYRYDVVIADVSSHYKDQNNQLRNGPKAIDCGGSGEGEYTIPANFQLGSMGGFLTYQEMLDNLDSMASKYPSIITPRQIIDSSNLTHEGRPIYWLRISDNAAVDEAEPELLYNSLHHAREPLSLSQLIMYMWYLLENYDSDPSIKYLVDNTEQYFIPCLNPDGYIYNETTDPTGGGMWRKNRRNNGGSYGVDLNRNYGYAWAYDNNGSSGSPSSDTYRGPSAFSEPETQNMRDFCNAHNFFISVNYHSYGNMLVYPWAYNGINTADSTHFKEFSKLLTQYNKYITGTGTETVGYNSNGDADDWLYGEQGTKNKILSMTPEVGSGQYGFWPPQSEIEGLCEATIWQNLGASWLMLNYGTVRDDAPPILTSSNPQISYKVKRYGEMSGTLTVSISPITANIQSVGASKNYTLNQFEEQDDSIQIQLDPAILSGELVQFLLSVSNGGAIFSDTISKVYGAYDIAFEDDGSTMDNWTNIGAASNWEVTTSEFYEAPSSITDSRTGEYENNETSEIILVQSLDLSGATDASITFWGKWDVEEDYDYVQVMAADDPIGGNFLPLCGLYTKSGTQYQDEGEPVFDGEQNFWVQENMSLNDYLGQPEVVIKIRLVADQWVKADGFYFDDFKVNVLSSTVGILPTPKVVYHLGQNQPNPGEYQVYIPFQLEELGLANPRLTINNVLGQQLFETSIDANSSGIDLDVSNWDDGLYFYQIVADDFQSAAQKMLIQK